MWQSVRPRLWDNAPFAAKGIEVVTVKPTSYTGICEVHIHRQNHDQIIYTGSDGSFFLMGQLYDAASGRNLTRRALEAATRFSAAEMLQLKELTAFLIGKTGQTLYYATDPYCTFCKAGSEILKKLAAAGELRVNFLLYPLSETSRKESASVICDGKSLVEFEEGYHSGNLCSEGIQKIDETVTLLEKNNVSGTPTYIFPDGRFHTGLLEEEALRGRLGPADSTGTP